MQTMLLLFDGSITLIQELGSTKTYEITFSDENSIVDNHCYKLLLRLQ